MTVNASADLRITKLASTTTVAAGGTYSYAIVIVNAGPSSATDVTVTDVLPAGISLVSSSVSPVGSLTVSSLAGVVTAVTNNLSVGTATVTLTVVSGNQGTASVTVTNVATGTSTTPDPTPGNNTGTSTVTVTAQADLATLVLVPPNGIAGTVVTATVTFTNNGTSTAAQVTGTIVIGTTGGVITTVTYPIGTLTPGQTVSQQVTFTVPASGPVGATSTVTTTMADPNLANNTSNDTMSVNANADLRVTKIASAATVPAGVTYSYALVVVNAGPSSATDVTVTDVLPAGITLVSSSVSPVGSMTVSSLAGVVTAVSSNLSVGTATVTLTVVSGNQGTASVTVTNVATGTTTTPDPTPGNNTGTSTVTITASADVATLVDLPGTGIAGTNVTATVTFTNNGTSTAANVTGSVVIGTTGGTITTASYTLGNLNPGQSVTQTVTFTVPTTQASATSTVTTTTADPTPSNNVSTDTMAVNASADLRVTKVASSTQGTAGSTITYTLTLVNAGPSVAQNVTLTDVLGAGQVLLGSSGNNGTVTVAGTSAAAATSSLALNGTLTLSLQVQVTATTGAITDTAAGTSTTPDPDTSNNTTTLAVPVSSSADLTVTKVASSVSGTAGQTINYVVTLVNRGPSIAQNVTLTDVLSAGQSLVSASSNNGTTTVPGASAAATTTSLAVNGTLTLTLQANVTATTGNITDTAAGISTTPDPNTSNNTTTLVVPVSSSADLSITKVASNAVGTVGQTISYTITYRNLGPSTAQNVTVTDVLPTGLTLLSAGSSLGTVSTSTASVTVTMAALPAGGTGTVTMTVSIGAAAASNIVNVANIVSTTPDPSTANNSSTATVSKTDSTDLRVTLTVPANASPGSTVTAVVVVFNAGPSPASNVTATLSLTNNASSSTATTVLSVFTIPTLAANTSATTTVSYAIPPAQTQPMNWTATVATTVVESNYGNNTATAVTNVAIVTNASLSGRVWFDINRNRVFDSTTVDTPLQGFRVELLKVTGPGTTTTVVGSATTDVNGQYTISGQVPGPDYTLRFRDPLGNLIYGTPFNQKLTTQNSNPSTGTNVLVTSVSPNQTVTTAGYIGNITLYAGDNVQEQNLPLDPSGVVYDSVSRQPIPGATVKLVGPAGFDPTIHLVGGTDTQITPAIGLYQYLFVNNPPSGVYTLQITPPAGYAPPNATQGGVAAPQGVFNVPGGVTNIQAQATAPAVGTNGAGPTGGVGTQYYFQLNFSFPGSGEVFNNHIPLDPLASGAILVNKTGNKTVAEVGDSVQYTIRMRNTTGTPIANVTLEDLLPAGFRYILETTRLNNATVTNPAGGVGRALTFNIGTIPANAVYELTYFVRLGVGSQQGDGINRATAVFPGASGAPVRSNTALFKVSVQGGVFSNEGCIVGKVYVDCDGNGVQNNDGGSREVGIPGVRLVMLDGTWIVTDNEGKYSICGVKAQTQVIKVDRTTLPKGSRMVPSSNRNAGVGDSIFVDMKGGELHRADFIEGSCSPEVMDQIKARRTVDGVSLPMTDKDNQALKPDFKPAEIMPAVPGGAR